MSIVTKKIVFGVIIGTRGFFNARLAAEGRKNLLMVPLSFVSDHIETLHEIDIQYAAEAKALGVTRFVRSPSLNSSPLFLACLADLVRKAQA